MAKLGPDVEDDEWLVDNTDYGAFSHMVFDGEGRGQKVEVNGVAVGMGMGVGAGLVGGVNGGGSGTKRVESMGSVGGSGSLRSII